MKQPDAGSIVILSGVIVAVGQTLQGGTFTFKQFVGFGVASLLISAIAVADDALAGKFALLLLLAAMLWKHGDKPSYAVTIFEKVTG